MAAGSRARNARVDLEVGRGKFDRGLRDAKKGLRGFAADIKKSLASGGKKVLGGVLEGVGALAGIGGGLGIASVVTDVVDLERGLARFQIATDGTAQSTDALRDQLTRTSRATGISRNDLLSGASAYVALTGDADGARNSVALFGKVANATGANMDDLAAVAASMKDNLGINPADFEAGFSALAVQGKAGAIELRELATLLAGVAPSFSQFDGGGGAKGLAAMGAALQVVRKGFGSSSEAATGMRALMVSINRNAKQFERVGVKIYDKDPKTGKRRLKDFRDIIDGIGASRLVKDPTALTKAFGSDEAKRAFDQLMLNRGLLDELILKSSDKNAIDRDAQTYQQSTAGRLERAWNGVKLIIAEALTPENIAGFVTALEHVVSLVNKIASGFGAVADALVGVNKGMAEQISNARADAENSARAWELQTGHGGGIVMTPQQAQQRVGTENAAVWDSLYGGYTADQIAAAKASARSKSQWGQGFDPSARHVYGELVGMGYAPGAAAFAQARQAGQPIVVEVKVDADVVAKAIAKAPSHRTRPGGR